MLRRTLLCGRKVEKVMVANRGEIACRVFRTCRDLHIQTVALFCEAEQNAKHVMEADEAVCIGPPPAVRSYLRGDHIVSVAKSLGVDAIHPGYGFLSENAPFADAVAKAGIEFIGPPASAIVSMGSKSESKRIMEAAGVPVVPGYYGDDQSKDRLMAEANKIGYPVLIKAVSGGGGKGMKIVDKEEDFELLLDSAKREATNFFKDDRVILERYITLPRHIECQIFCDMHGNGVFFFERDCSVQRRYQKVLEEAPAPHLSPEMRQQIGSVAVKAAKAVGYVGAGTVEFIFDTASDDFYFMEMNTRLQVEHPVSEEVCRIKGAPVDLVKLQILTAMGKPLGFSQEDVSLAGSCIEARVYAESPEKGFLPESGHLAYIKEPTQGLQQTTKVRLDTGFRQGDDVLIHYDPMISKLIVWGKDRTEALHGLRRALDEYHIVGINTNVEFLKRCLETKAFQDGGVTTNFIKENQDTLLKPKDIPAHVYVMAALSLVLRNGAKLSDAFRLNADVEQTISFQKADAALAVRLSSRSSSAGALSYQTQGTTGSLTLGEVKPRADASGLELVAFFDHGMRYNATVIFNERHVSVVVGGVVYKVETTPLMDGFGDASVMSSGSSRVLSPMPGKVGKLLVKPGSHVEKGQSILILEAMKMEHVIKSPKCGVVSFTVREGDMVGADQPMGAVSESD